jgi:flavin-dependent dehydrogenase
MSATRNHFQVAVIGGGPAGAHLAYHLATRNVEVMVFVPARYKEKACGGGVSLGYLERYPIFQNSPFLDPCSTHHLSGVTLYLRQEEMHVSCQPPLAIVKRAQFDTFLLSKAETAGATVIREKVSDVSPVGTSSGWQVRTCNDVYKADILAGADGVRSVVRRCTIGQISPHHLALTVGYTLADIPVKDGVIAFVGTEGYLWVLPRLDGSASVGLGSRLGSDKARRLWSILDEFLRQRYGRVRVLSQWTALLPTVCQPSFYTTPCSGTNWLLVGDAAGHVEPVWGAGIGLALESGWLAARAIAEGSIGQYEAMWRDSYGDSLITQSNTAGILHAMTRFGGMPAFECCMQMICRPWRKRGEVNEKGYSR